MKAIKSRTYKIIDNQKVLISLGYIITSGNKYFSSSYNIDKNRNARKISEERKIGGKLTNTFWHFRDKILKTNFYYLNGKKKRTETISDGAVQQYINYSYDRQGNLLYAESEDNYIYYQNIYCTETNKSMVIEYSYFKWSEPIDENIKVEIFEGSLLVRVLEIEDLENVYSQMLDVINHYEKFKSIINQIINYIDFSGEVPGIQVTGSHYETHYEYYDNGNLKRKASYYCTRQERKQTLKHSKLNEELLFNKNGTSISRRESYGEDNYVDYKYEYEYNDKGQWIESRELKQGELISITERTEEKIDNIV